MPELATWLGWLDVGSEDVGLVLGYGGSEQGWLLKPFCGFLKREADGWVARLVLWEWW